VIAQFIYCRITGERLMTLNQPQEVVINSDFMCPSCKQVHCSRCPIEPTKRADELGVVTGTCLRCDICHNGPRLTWDHTDKKTRCADCLRIHYEQLGVLTRAGRR